MRSVERRRVLLLFLLCLQLARTTPAQQSAPAELDSKRATKLAELMCAQLPNVATIPAFVRIETSSAPANLPPEGPIVMDDVYDALVRVGSYSLPCLTDRLLDTRWMPDPRSEPLLGAPLVGDVAYMILMNKGVEDLMPRLTHKNDLRMDDYFLWPIVGRHRHRLQNAVREWLPKNPSCCGVSPAFRHITQSAPRFRMSPSELSKTRAEFNHLHPGINSAEVLRVKGQPDAIDPGEGADHFSTNLLGWSANNHNENLAYIYFTERWTADIARRDPLRDRYVIVFFSAEGKMTRMLSNVPEIPSIFPHSYAAWMQVMWGQSFQQK
jgi:hypothetical protein